MVVEPYRRERAVAYARKWAFGRNPLFPNFAGIGGDCTNFISQCIYAGCCTMNFSPVLGWYYISLNDRAPAWVGVSKMHLTIESIFALIRLFLRAMSSGRRRKE